MSRSSEAHSNTDLGQHSDAFSSLIAASLQTTGGIVGLLLIVQFLTGVLLAFYYVPSVDHAHTTVSFIEKVLSGGSWLRSLHHYGSQLLPVFLFLTVVAWRFRGPKASLRVCWPNLSRQAIAAGLVFLGLAIWSMKVPAPLGPSVLEITTAYLPRPGAQFLWLYQSLKYIPGRLGSLVGTVLPGIVLLILVLIPWIDVPCLKKLSTRPQRLIAGVILACSALLVLTMTTLSYVSDRRDPRTVQQLARQAAQEHAFRKEPFKPTLLNLADAQSSRQVTGPVNSAQEGPPA